jgi:hypothetical protein
MRRQRDPPIEAALRKEADNDSLALSEHPVLGTAWTNHDDRHETKQKAKSSVSDGPAIASVGV